MADDTETVLGDVDSLDAVTLAVRDLIGVSRELTGRIARATGANATDMAAIGLLIQFGQMGAAELAGRLGIRSASATALIDRLENSGQAVRVRDTQDRRRVVVTATADARAANLAAWLPVINEIDEASRALPGTDRGAVLAFLRRITAIQAGSGQTPGPRDAD